MKSRTSVTLLKIGRWELSCSWWRNEGGLGITYDISRFEATVSLNLFNLDLTLVYWDEDGWIAWEKSNDPR